MIDDSGKFEEGLKQLLKYLPAGFEEASDEVKKTLRAGLAAALQKMDLVSREEYDIQVKLLEHLGTRVHQLEEQLKSVQPGVQSGVQSDAQSNGASSERES